MKPLITRSLHKAAAEMSVVKAVLKSALLGKSRAIWPRMYCIPGPLSMIVP